MRKRVGTIKVDFSRIEFFFTTKYLKLKKIIVPAPNHIFVGLTSMWWGWVAPWSDSSWRWSGSDRCSAWLCWRCWFVRVMFRWSDLVRLDPWFVCCRFVQSEAHYSAWADPMLVELIDFWNGWSGDDSGKSNRRFDLRRKQSNVQDPGREVSRW